jgi:DNA-binding transcriptional LysR family regulator
MDRAEAISVFVEVADRRSFVAAARRLKRSPTAVTRAISNLEARLGVRLFNRTTRAVSLTEAGDRFLAGAVASSPTSRRSNGPRPARAGRRAVSCG